ncbi:MAG: VWA domain-containing protein [Clostridia bacterium]|nr:VWA domain-containing protein [Clostridia bacterium]
MELVYPWVLIIGIPLLIITILWKIKRQDKFKSGSKVANTKYVTNMPYYKKIMRKYKFLSATIKVVCVLTIILSLILFARPVSVDTIEPEKYNRDIFLCMDISTSVITINKQVVQQFKKIVKELNGERIGITIFNRSAVIMVPLTDDYDYLLDTLDKLEEGFDSFGENANIVSLSDYYYNYAGTMEGPDERGSSLIGDGLASCVYGFSNLEENRARTIIFSTDNDLQGTPIYTLKEAAQVCKSKGVTVYGITTSLVRNEEDFKDAMELTGGNLYQSDSSTTIKDIVENINNREKTLLKENKKTIKTGIPQVPFIMLVISILVLFVLNKRVNL